MSSLAVAQKIIDLLAVGIGVGGLIANSRSRAIDVADIIFEAGGIDSVNKGKEGVERAKKEIEAQGDEIAGQEVTIDTPSGKRTRVDLVVKKKDGSRELVEVKNGPKADLNSNQKKAFPEIRKQGGTPQGENAREAGLTPGQPIGPTPVRVIKYK